MLGCRRLLWISISRRSCFSTLPCCSSVLCRTFNAHTKPVLRSLDRYTRPNLPLPSGRPISNMPRWNCFGRLGCSYRGLDRRCVASSSDLPSHDDDPMAFRGGEAVPFAAAGPRHCAAWDVMLMLVMLEAFSED